MTFKEDKETFEEIPCFKISCKALKLRHLQQALRYFYGLMKNFMKLSTAL